MLKKQDLAQQFELVVQQEIKNYQDSLNFVLQSINELKESIKDIQRDVQTRYAIFDSVTKSLATRMQELKESQSLNLNQLYRIVNDQSIMNDSNRKILRDRFDLAISKIKESEGFYLDISSIKSDISGLKSDLEEKSNSLKENINAIFARFSKELLRFKEEIISAPSECSIVKKDLEEQIASYKVDVSGIMKELLIYKKENYITQKKIENIYTLIERISKSEVSS